MSHLISGISLPPEPLFNKCKLKDVISPKYKHLLKQNSPKKHKNNESWKQEVAISIMCKKLSQKEYLLLRKQNASQIQHHFSKLKLKIKKNLQPNAISVGRFFENLKQDNTLDVKRIMQRMPQKINLSHKYNHKLINFAESINDARKISNEKQNYLRWLDHENNSPIKSPNYSRMSFVLQRLQSCDNRILNSSSLLGNLKNRKNYHESSIITVLKNEDYKPKLHRMKTLGNDQIPLLR